MKLERKQFDIDLFYCAKCKEYKGCNAPTAEQILAVPPGKKVPFNVCPKCDWHETEQTMVSLELDPIARVEMDVTRYIKLRASGAVPYSGDQVPNGLADGLDSNEWDEFTAKAHDEAFEADHDNNSYFVSAEHIGWRITVGEAQVVVLTCGKAESSDQVDYDDAKYDEAMQNAIVLEPKSSAGDLYLQVLEHLGIGYDKHREWEPLGQICVALTDEADKGAR